MVKVQSIKGKFDKLGLIKIKTFFSMGDSVNTTNRQVIGWEKVFANHVADRGLISGIYILKLNSFKTIGEKKSMKRHFTKEDIQVSKHTKRCSASLAIREMQIITTIRYHLHLSEWLK